MAEETNFETYLFISSKEFIISVRQKFDDKVMYEQKYIINDNIKKLDFDLLNSFLEKNIFKIEKVLGNFLKSIFLVLDYNNFFPIKISLKKNFYGEKITSNSLKYLLNESKDQCKNSFNEKKIIHMIIENYQIDEKNYQNLPDNLSCDYLSIDVNFLCLSKNFINNLEDTLKKYQILINQIISARYANNLVQDVDLDLIKKAKLIKNGFNNNEVLLIKKIQKNKGFFEKFFDFFS